MAACVAALAAFAAGCASRQTAEGLLNEVKTQNSQGEHGRAVESATRLIELLEKEGAAAEGYFWRGYSYDLWKDRTQKGRRVSPDVTKFRDAAVADYEKALEKDAGFVEACFNVALIYYDEGRFEEALKYFERVTEMTPAKTGARGYVAEIYFRLGRYDEAAAALAKMVAGGTAAALEEARRLQREGRTDEAIEALDRAVRLNPESAEANSELAMMYLFRRRDTGRALYHLEKCRALLRDEDAKRGIEKMINAIKGLDGF